MKPTHLSAFGLLAALVVASCGGYFHEDDDFGGRERDRERGPSHQHGDDDCPDNPSTTADAGIPSATPDATILPDASENSDAGTTEGDAGEVADAGEASDASEPEDAGCQGDNCPCDRDDDCPEDQICNHPISTCEYPPVECTDLTTEAECLARPDCLTIYGGMNCRDANGGDCQSGDVDCTCETFSFAACIEVT